MLTGMPLPFLRYARTRKEAAMSTQQWHKILVFTALILTLAWSALGIAPGTSLATEEQVDFFPAPAQYEIDAILRNVHRKDKQVTCELPKSL